MLCCVRELCVARGVCENASVCPKRTEGNCSVRVGMVPPWPCWADPFPSAGAEAWPEHPLQPAPEAGGNRERHLRGVLRVHQALAQGHESLCRYDCRLPAPSETPHAHSPSLPSRTHTQTYTTHTHTPHTHSLFAVPQQVGSMKWKLDRRNTVPSPGCRDPHELSTEQQKVRLGSHFRRRPEVCATKCCFPGVLKMSEIALPGLCVRACATV